MKTLLKSIKWLLLLSGILVVILGITMLFTPLENLVTLAMFVGISMLMSGVSEIVSFCNEAKDHRSGWMLASGVLTAFFAVWALFGRGTEALAAMLPYIFAVWVISSGLLRIAGAIAVKSEGSNLWSWILAFGIVGTALGFLLLFSPILSAVVISCSIGCMLVSYGIDNVILFFRLKKIGDRIRDHLGELT